MFLILDTSTEYCLLYLYDISKDKILKYKWLAKQELSRYILGFIKDKITENNITLDRIIGIGVNKGEGSYTGLRIGLTVCNTLAKELNIPIVGVKKSDSDEHEWMFSVIKRLKNNEDDKLVLPLYINSPKITQPKK